MKVEICSDHTGKMEGIESISTSVLLNPFCQKNRKILGSICTHCYAENLAKMYSGLAARLARNTEVLTKEVIKWEDLPEIPLKIGGNNIFRFEAFGDIVNETHLLNYYNIVKKNPWINFSLYTKRYTLVAKFFDREDIDIPPNLTLIFSSLMVNIPINISSLKTPGKFRKGQIKTFTVYEGSYIKKHPELKINCGAKACAKCKLCYLKNEVEEIREILKSERNSTERYFSMKDPKKREEIIKGVDDFIEKAFKDNGGVIDER